MVVVMYHLHIELLLTLKLYGYVCTNIGRVGLRNGPARQLPRMPTLGH